MKQLKLFKEPAGESFLKKGQVNWKIPVRCQNSICISSREQIMEISRRVQDESGSKITRTCNFLALIQAKRNFPQRIYCTNRLLKNRNIPQIPCCTDDATCCKGDERILLTILDPKCSFEYANHKHSDAKSGIERKKFSRKKVCCCCWWWCKSVGDPFLLLFMNLSHL